jgi:hypothetical protein
VIDNIGPKKKYKLPIFSNLNFPTGPGMTLDEIEVICQRYLSALPDEIKTAMQNDSAVSV